MLDRLLDLFLRQRGFVLLATLALLGVGGWAALRLPLDAVPDITNPQVQINTTVSALAPEEIEKQVTFPIENVMGGIPGMVEFRSLSKSGLSQVTMIFEDGTDLYRARQLVTERLQQAAEDLPPGLTPKLAPIATGLGEIFYYVVDYRADAPNKPASRREQLMQLKLIHDYQIKPQLRQTRGVAEINVSGGYDKMFVIQPDPARLRSVGLSLPAFAAKIAENTRNAGGGIVDLGGEQVTLRANSRVTTTADILQLPLKFGGGAKAILVGDVAEVAIGSGYRTGASTEGGQEVLLGAAIMTAGGNSRLVSRALAERLREIQEKLPPGIAVHTVYDRSELVDRTIATVEKNLVEGAVLVVVVLFLLLGNIRGALIVALAIPLSMLFAMIGMVELHIPGNLMSLGAIDFGLIIDGAVVMVENILRHLGMRQHELGRRLTPSERAHAVLVSAKEVARPMFFGVLIITMVYGPILALQGIEGKMFKPMAIVVMLALGGALVLAAALMPVLCSYLLGGRIEEQDNGLMRLAKRVYAPLLDFGLRHRWLVAGPMILLFAVSLWMFSRLGAEFIPELDEGDAVLQLVKSQSIGLPAALAIQQRSEQVLIAEFPEIRLIFSRMGAAEIATDPMDPGDADTYVMLKPPATWRKVGGRPMAKDKLMEAMQETLARKVPGQAVLINQPIALRFGEIMAGARAELSLKIFGDDYAILERLADEARALLEQTPGAGDVEFDKIGRTPQLEIRPDRAALRRFNLQADDVNKVVETALAGAAVGFLPEGSRRFPLVVRVAEDQRGDVAAIRRLPVGTDGGGMLTLDRVATVTPTTQIGTVMRENAQRRVAILINVRGRDTAGFVAEAQAKLHAQLKLPEGYYFEFGGQFKNLVAARQRLTLVVPLALALIFGLIFVALGSVRQVLLVYTGIPLAITGGIFAIWLRDMPFTISAGVGFIALSGVAVLNGLMMISSFNLLRGQGRDVATAVREGALTRLRPVLMTALVASLGFVPMAIATGAGAEVQRPLATVVIGGIVTSTFLTLVLLPALYAWAERKAQPGN
jgi:cobalt-zinc-cadmium resistance protein CzcA